MGSHEFSITQYMKCTTSPSIGKTTCAESEMAKTVMKLRGRGRKRVEEKKTHLEGIFASATYGR